ncbi:acyl dehydratase [Frateuria aurantia DSM 6220]|uniref:Acyl dehydratase n=2 Tax=Frateuria aurantia TaxID=81475 RepID=H8L4P6_FRAAD|nr:acyl dehydratase [Frateuria aurantia DSM 6220]
MQPIHAFPHRVQAVDLPLPRKQLLWRAVRSSRKHSGPEAELPLTVLEQASAPIRASEVADYAQVCQLPSTTLVPLTYPHILAFPLQMQLLIEPDFPYAAVGLVHIANTIRQHRPLASGQALKLQVQATRQLAHPKGQLIVLKTEAALAGELAWESESVYLSRSVRHPQGPAFPSEPASSETLTELESWTLPADLGRRYAKVAGDYNPIHLYPWTARLFGYPRAIAHGMWSKARALGSLLPKAQLATAEVSVRFKTPALLPGKASLLATADHQHFAVHRAGTEVPHLSGHLQGVATV